MTYYLEWYIKCCGSHNDKSFDLSCKSPQCSEIFPRCCMFRSPLITSISIGKIRGIQDSWGTIGLRTIHSCPYHIPVRSLQIYSFQKSEKCVLDNVYDIMLGDINGRTHRYTLSHDVYTIPD